MRTSVIGKKGKLVALLGAFAVVLGGAISPLTAQAETGNPDNVETWSELEAALASDASTITITKDIVAEGGKTLNVTKAVTIKGDATIYRDAEARSYEPMFTVSGNGNLTLAGNLKLSGKGMTCGLAPVKHDEGWKQRPAKEKYKAVEGKRVMLGFAESDRSQSDSGPGIAYIGDDDILHIAGQNNVLEADDNGYLRLKGDIDDSKYVFTVTDVDDDDYQAAWFNTTDGRANYVIGRSDFLTGDLAPVIVMDRVNNTDVHKEAHKIENDSRGNFKFSMAGDDGLTQKFIIPNNNQNNGGEPDKQDYVVAGARPQVNLTYGWEKTWLWAEDIYWTVEGATEDDGSLTHFATEEEAQEWADANGGSGSDNCTVEATCSKVTGKKFKGARGDEKGFFVQVNGGTFNLTNNAELSDLITDETVTYAAPVVSKGGKVNISGGTITHNSVGYSAKNGDSGLRANKIWMSKKDGWNEDGKLAQYKNTETAGAIILTEGSEGVISGGTISGNRGDTGAIVVQGKPDRDRSGARNENVENGNNTKSSLQIQGGTINNNVGVHHAGAVYVFNGAIVEMTGGAITNNFAWNKGGAVWASEESYASFVKNKIPSHLRVGDATFILKGGKLSGNMAVNRGGAINVMSDHVALLGGEVTGNYSRVLGGAVYVEGDASDRLYQLFIAKGCITDNHAVPGSKNATSAPLYRTLNRADGCAFSNAMDGAEAGDVSDHVDYNNYYGHGGGVWLCSFGGNTTFAVPSSEVSLWHNDASGKGQDLVVRPLKKAQTNGFSFLDLGTQVFRDEDRNGVVYSNETVQGRVLTGPVHATATSTGTCAADGVKISGNVAPVGGGIAANGNVVFGDKAEIAQMFTSLKITKEWSSERQKKPIGLKLYAEVDGQRVDLPGYEVTLDGNADAEPGEDGVVWESSAWVAETGMPLSVVVGNKTVPLFTFDVHTEGEGDSLRFVANDTPDDTSDDLDPSKITDLVVIAKGVQSGKLTKDNAKLANWKLVVEETIGGEVQTDVVDLGSGVLENLEFLGTDTTDLKDMNDNIVGELDTYKVGMNFTNTIGNDIKPSVEKYVNKDVHSNIVEFDKEFTYDVMAYVPLDATKVTITDTLVNGLEFADVDGKATTDVRAAVQSVVVKPTNDHKPKGTVAQASDTRLNLNVADGDKHNPATIDGSTLTVTIDREQALSAARGKWIQVTFNARIKDEYRNIDALKALVNDGDVKSWQAVAANENAPVLSDQPHEGMANKATYTVYTPSNEGGSDYETNTVTVTPDTTQLMVEKTWNVNGSAEWPSEVENVTFGVFAKKADATEPVMVDADGKVVPADTDGARPLTVELTAGKTTDTVKDLPKLQGVTYSAKEVAVNGVSVNYSEDAQMAGIVKVSDLLELIANTVKKTVGEGENAIDNFIATNETPQVEKYVNNDVHSDLESFDEVFEYSVMAYVPEGATKVEISDTLTKDLLFVDLNGKVQGQDGFDATKLITNSKGVGKYDLVIEPTNDHTVGGTVAEHSDVGYFSQHPEQHLNGPIVNGGVQLSPDGKAITVTVNEDELNAHGKQIDAHGKWIVLSFRATINPASYDKVRQQLAAGDDPAVEGLSWQKIADDKTVLNGTKPHAGLDNTAKYKVYVGNEGSSDYETNTVTVKPKEAEKFTVKFSKVEFGIKTVEIPGAKIKVTDSKGKVVSEWTSTDKPHKLQLEPGEYTFEEVNAPEGFDAITTTVKFIVDENGTVTLKEAYEDINGAISVKDLNHLILEDIPTKYEVIISKQELGDDTKELPGARIKVTDSKGNVVDEWTSTTEAHKLKLTPGEYELEEVNAPEGFQAITTKIRFKVDNEGKVTVLNAEEITDGNVRVIEDALLNHLVLEDIRKTANVSVTVTKAWLNAQKWPVAAPALWPAGAEVTVNIKDGDTVVKTVVLNADNQSETVTGLPKLVGRDYAVEEVEVVGVYSLEGEPEITTDEDGNVTAKLTNRLLPRRSELSVEVAKVDPLSKVLEGAELEVTGVDLDGKVIDLGEQAVWTTDGTNHFLAHIVPGTYTLREKKAPKGYKVADPIEFEVTLEGVLKVDGKIASSVITMVDEPNDTPEESPSVEPTTPSPSPSSTAPTTAIPTPEVPERHVKSLVRTGAPVAVALLAAFALAGAGMLMLRRRANQ